MTPFPGRLETLDDELPEEGLEAVRVGADGRLDACGLDVVVGRLGVTVRLEVAVWFTEEDAGLLGWAGRFT